MKEAEQYRKLEDNLVGCFLCAHRCVIEPAHRGKCAVRENRGGTLFTLVYDKVVSAAIDPIEKKPLYHFLPGSRSLSIATVGCNFRCLHCQNFSISQLPRDHDGAIEGTEHRPADLVAEAFSRGCASISYTYTEPTIYFELARECAVLGRARGLKNVFVTNGYMTIETLSLLPSFLDAANVDLKGFDDAKYLRLCGAHLQPVLDSIQWMWEHGIWVEVTTLLIPGHNDSPEELQQIATFLRGISPDLPWHVSAFHPTYRLTDRPATRPAQVDAAARIGREAGLRYVYGGNVSNRELSVTRCWSCGTVLIERAGYALATDLVSGRPAASERGAACPRCSTVIAGVYAHTG